jgi:K+-transporting ATPase A subunit
MARVYQGERTFLDPVLRPLERLLYRLSGVHPGGWLLRKGTPRNCCSMP